MRFPDVRHGFRGIKPSTLIELMCVFGLAACGNGSDPSLPSVNGANPSVLTGVLLDAPVQGVAFSTPTRSGVTDVGGRFEYLAGETVTFSLYGREIGQASGGATLTPFDLTSELKHPDFALNVIRLLQTMDSDGDLANGISLAPVAGVIFINFDQPTATFEVDANVASVIGTRVLVSPSNAMTHLNGSLAAGHAGYSVNLAGRTARSTASIDICPGSTLGYRITFGESAYTRNVDPTASMSVGGCVLEPPLGATFTGPYSNFPDSSVACGPICSYADLNKVVLGQVDGNGQPYAMVVQHTAGTKVITSTRIMATNPSHSSFYREVITLD